jgi:hypothetical protein
MKKLFLSLLIPFVTMSEVEVCSAQTNVSGGIYANTTWTLANSPYIVTDTVVVFPGVTLTIEAGVVVKFDDDKKLEIRGTIIANGTLADSITFTSNNSTPISGSHAGVFLNNSLNPQVNYCNFFFGSKGLSGSHTGTLYIKNCSFYKNQSGLNCGSSAAYPLIVDSCTFLDNTAVGYSAGFYSLINNCYFRNNLLGIYLNPTSGQVFSVKNCLMEYNPTGIHANNGIIENCIIKYGQTGIEGTGSGGKNSFRNCTIDSNTVCGIQLEYQDTMINCEVKYNGIGVELISPWLVTMNIIENNSIGIRTQYSMIYFYCNRLCNNSSYDLYYYGTSNRTCANNYWCTTDSLSISTKIYDGYDDISYGLITFQPVDSNQCYLNGCNIHINADVTNATCDTCHNGEATAYVTNGFPPYSYTWYTTPIQTTQSATALASGTYTVCVTDGHGCTACNYNVFVDSTNCTGFSLSVNSTNASCSLCNDGSATAIVTGTPPFNYIWYTSPIQNTPTATGLAAGNYYDVCVTDVYGCSACDTATIGIGSCSAYYVINANPTPHTYDLVNMASGTPPLTYDWNWGDASAHDTAAYPSHTYAGAGTYTICLTITDSAGCTVTYCHGFYLLEEFLVTPVYVNVIPPTTTGIAEANAKSFSIYPNPVKSTLAIESKSPIENITIRCFDGRVIKSLVISHWPLVNIDVSDLSSGIYFIEVNETSRQRFVKQ